MRMESEGKLNQVDGAFDALTLGAALGAGADDDETMRANGK